MKFINPLMIIWLAIQMLTIYLTFFSQSQDSVIIFWITFPFFILNCIGIAIILTGKPKTGSILFLIGSVVFMPIGLIGAMGARKNLNQIKEDKFIKTLNT
ncbi:hypothetical protein [Aquimarina litoralis]|uniref:hypothetical protein n=1 Tax=Aquimarina litoralis TaxID=584605 RepID=UPI001C57B5B1|nr:hypothetical protein [Aquimarina litoralis]MBW1295726.1 hypothetical protein [Aquimarina litoralis]